MNKLFLAVGGTAIIVVSLTSSVRAEGIREGKWSMTIVTMMAGMEDQMAEAQESMAEMSDEDKAMMQQMMGGMGIGMGGEGMTITTSQCLTNDDPVPSANEDKDCESTHSMQGNTVTFEETCRDSHSTGEITYEEDTMHGLINSQGKDGNVTIEISGEYEGPCEE